LICLAQLRPTSDRPNSIFLPQFRSRDFTSAQLHPSRSQVKPSSPRVLHTSSSRTHPLHPFWIQLCGSNCGATPSARDDGRIDTLWVASAAEWRPLQEPPKTLLKHTTTGAKVPCRHNIAAVNRDRRDLDEKKAGYRRFRVATTLEATNVDVDLVYGFQIIGIVHSCPYCMQTKGEAVAVFLQT
jgi:hypothetical protein